METAYARLDRSGHPLRHPFVDGESSLHDHSALLSLTLALGANTAIFSLLNAVMLRTLPVKNPQRLVNLQQRSPSFTNPLWEQVRDHASSFDGALAFNPNPQLNVDLGRFGVCLPLVPNAP